MDRREIAERIVAGLELRSPPIALAFVESAPDGVESFQGEVPSACAFWRKAETGVFYAPVGKHLNCAIGAMTLGFELPEQVRQELMALVTKMCDLGYLSPQEPLHIPTAQKSAGGIVYGPLADLPLEPDVVLLWLTPQQAMLYNEAIGKVQWTASAPLTIRGRPACAALPLAMSSAQSTISLGCMGMRTFTEISAEQLLVVLPGSQASELAASLGPTLAANAAMREFYEGRKAMFTA